MSGGPMEVDDITGGCTTYIPRANIKLIWELRDADHWLTERPLPWDCRTDAQTIECPGLGHKLNWKIFLRAEGYNEQRNLEIGLGIVPTKSDKWLPAETTYYFVLGEPGPGVAEHEKTEEFRETFYLTKPGGHDHSFAHYKASVPLESLVKNRENKFPQGILRITAFLRMTMNLVTIPGVREFPFLAEPAVLPDDYKASLFDNKVYSDVIIQCNEREFAAHRNILGQSTVFAAMFASDMQEARTGRVVVDDIGENVFEMFLKSMYGAPIEFPQDHKELIELLHCAEKYDQQLLKRICLHKMLKMITEENAEDLYLAAIQYCEDKAFQTFFHDTFLRKTINCLSSPKRLKTFLENFN